MTIAKTMRRKGMHQMRTNTGTGGSSKIKQIPTKLGPIRKPKMPKMPGYFGQGHVF